MVNKTKHHKHGSKFPCLFPKPIRIHMTKSYTWHDSSSSSHMWHDPFITLLSNFRRSRSWQPMKASYKPITQKSPQNLFSFVYTCFLFLIIPAFFLCWETLSEQSPQSVWLCCIRTLIFKRTATHCNTLQHTATHCNTLQHTATHCITLPYHISILQHVATHSNTIQSTATQCNLLHATHSPTMYRAYTQHIIEI